MAQGADRRKIKYLSGEFGILRGVIRRYLEKQRTPWWLNRPA